MFESLPGFREFYPDACFRRNYIFNTWRQVVCQYGFDEYDGPVLEPLDLYTRKSGDEIVEQLFAFTDKGGREVALRPEMTPTLARMIGARAQSMKRPIKWFTVAENFRYERPSRGRLRSHYQLNADIYGEPGIGAEVELLSMLVSLFRAFGLTSGDVTIRLSDRDLWVYYLRSRGLEDAACYAALSVIDKMERTDEEASLKALSEIVPESPGALWKSIRVLAAIQSVEALEIFLKEEAVESQADGELDARLDTLRSLFRDLGQLGVGDFVKLDLGIVRGLAYYTGFVFEAFESSGEGRALAGGGRYDQLVEKLGGPSIPAVGFGFGDVMIELVLDQLGKLPNYEPSLDVYMVFNREGAEATQALLAISQLREAGITVEYSLKKSGFGKQFREANQKGARLVVICGQEEAASGVFKIKAMDDGTESTVDAAMLATGVRERL